MAQKTAKHGAPNLRRLALDILTRVEHGRFAEGLLQNALSGKPTEKADRAFLQELVYGTIRRRGLLNAVIAACSDVKLSRMEERVLAALRIGAYQLLFMSRVPQSAAVNETVEAASEERGARNFCNAVLRAIAQSATFAAKETDSTRSFEISAGRAAAFDREIFPPVEKNPAAHIAAKYSHPESLVARWIKRFGVEETIALCRANNRTPQVYARRNSLKISQQDFLEKLKSEFTEVRSVESEMVTVTGGSILSSSMLESGEMIIQDPAPAKVAPFLAPQPGESVLDLCAAPGGKMAHIAELMQDRGRLVAVDSHHDKVRLIEENRRRLGITCVEIINADGREYAKEHAGEFDRVLLDVPCSNTGVLARRVEARWRFGEIQLRELTALQAELFAAAADAVKPGGSLVYSTCSIEEEENAQMVESFLKTHTDFSLDESHELLPHRGISDGGFMARLKKTDGRKPGTTNAHE
ncbi:MAG: 16S rRNA (cytosine(967)-C(5))-methyltransferase RsmB [Planctomycetota bacterium]